MSDKRFNASVNCNHRATLTVLMARVPVGGGSVIITPEEDVQLRDLAGGLNYWATQPGGCDSPAYPVTVHPTIAQGDYARKEYAASANAVDAFPFVLAGAPGSVLHLAAAEYKGQPWARLLTISTVAGDMDAPIRSAGKVPDVFLSVGGEFPAGTLLYANNILTEAPIPGSSGSGFSIVWPAP